MFGRNKKRNSTNPYINTSIAHDLANKAVELGIKEINHKHSMGNLHILGASVVVTIKNGSCKICRSGEAINLQVSCTNESDCRDLAEAVGCIAASKIEGYLYEELNISNPHVCVYTDHAPFLWAEVFINYGTPDIDEAGRIR